VQVYPTRKQQVVLSRWMGVARGNYNRCVTAVKTHPVPFTQTALRTHAVTQDPTIQLGIVSHYMASIVVNCQHPHHSSDVHEHLQVGYSPNNWIAMVSCDRGHPAVIDNAADPFATPRLADACHHKRASTA
jgi:hypothetical protein